METNKMQQYPNLMVVRNKSGEITPYGIFTSGCIAEAFIA